MFFTILVVMKDSMHTANVFENSISLLLHRHILTSPLPNDADKIFIRSLPQSRTNGGGVEYIRRKLVVVILVLELEPV